MIQKIWKQYIYIRSHLDDYGNENLWFYLQEAIEKTEAEAYLVVYSVVDKSSFSKAEQILNMLQDSEQLRTKACILVANKIDLARSRSVSTQGKYLVLNFNTKI